MRKLIDMHGGSVEARSDGLGKASEFTVRLPQSAQSLAPSPATARALPRTALPHRILVVDDDRDSRETLARLLTFLGSEVHTASDGPTALEAFRTYRPSVVLLDIGMPGMDGYELARRARRQPQGNDVMLIALSGWGQQEDRRRSKEAGIDHHLIKPVDLKALEKLLASLSPKSSAG